MQGSRDWFWYRFSMVEKVARVLLTNQRGKLKRGFFFRQTE